MICATCQGRGWVRVDKHDIHPEAKHPVDACGACAGAAEQQWRLARAARELPGKEHDDGQREPHDHQHLRQRRPARARAPRAAA